MYVYLASVLPLVGKHFFSKNSSVGGCRPSTWWSIHGENLLHKFKHLLLSYLYPLPKLIEVHPGPPGSIDRAIVQAILGTYDLPGVVQVHADHVHTPPTLWIYDDEDCDKASVYTGCLPLCRYLGRMLRIYPVHPRNALSLDVGLDHLFEFVRGLEARRSEGSVVQAKRDDTGGGFFHHLFRKDESQEELHAYIRTQLDHLEDRMEHYGEPWLEGMDACSLLDHCWWGVLQWIQEHVEDASRLDDGRMPCLSEWWDRMAANLGEGDAEEDAKKEARAKVD